MSAASEEVFLAVWGPYPNSDDLAGWQYGRMFWKDPRMRERLLTHWLDERHPYRDRFQEHRALVEEVLTSPLPMDELNRSLIERNTSLRCVVREIPPVFGSFWKDSEAVRPAAQLAKHL